VTRVAVDFKKRMIVTEDGRVCRFRKEEWDDEHIHVNLLYNAEEFLKKLKFQKKLRPDLFKQMEREIMEKDES